MLVDLDLHFGTVALNLDADPGSGLCEALEQPSRIDALFVDRATVKISETLRTGQLETLNAIWYSPSWTGPSTAPTTIESTLSIARTSRLAVTSPT